MNINEICQISETTGKFPARRKFTLGNLLALGLQTTCANDTKKNKQARKTGNSGIYKGGQFVTSYKVRKWVHTSVVVLTVVTLGLATLFVVHRFEKQRANNENIAIRRSLSDRMNTLRARIEGTVDRELAAAEGVNGNFALKPMLSIQDFQVVARHFLRDTSSVINLAYARDYVVEYVYPLERNRAVLGFDYRKSPGQLASLQRAIDIQAATFAGPIDLIQRRPGFVLRVPAFQSGEDDGALNLLGVTTVVLDASRFYEMLGLKPRVDGIELAIRKLDYDGDGQVFFGDAQVFLNAPVTSIIELPNARWQIAAVPVAGWLKNAHDYVFWRYVFAIFFVTIGLLSLNVYYMRKQRQQAEYILSGALEAVDDGFAVYDAKDRYVMSNHNYRAFYNKTRHLFRPGMSFKEIIREGVRLGQYPQAVGREEEFIEERLRSHMQADSELEQLLDNGRWLRISERRTKDGGTVGFRVDITELKNAQCAAERANKAKSDFLGVLSHELRTPLTVILGHAKFLANAEKMPAAREFSNALSQLQPDGELEQKSQRVMHLFTHQSQKIIRSGEHLLHLINQMLDLSQVESEKTSLVVKDVALETVFDEIAGQFQTIADAKGLTFTVDSGGHHVIADQDRLVQILLNLVGNAFKFTKTGRIDLRATLQDQSVVFLVKDTGCGIPEDEFETIFKEFHQVDSTATRSVGGTGLGLTITRQLVEALGGEISVTSEFGEGTTFRFTLPAALAETNTDQSPGNTTAAA